MPAYPRLVAPVRHTGRHDAESVRDCDCVTCRSESAVARAAPIRGVEDARIRRVVDQAFEPIRAKVAALEKRVDDASRTRDAEPLGCGWTRDADGRPRPLTGADLQRTADAFFQQRGKPAPQPGQPGYRFEGGRRCETSADMQALADAYWGRDKT